MNIVWQPQPRQREFMKRGEYEAFFGGAAGGGKSDCLVIEALRQVNVPNYKALILRKTYNSLTELVEKTQYYYPQACPKARYNGSTMTWMFPSGATIRFGNVQNKNYKTKYQGKQFDVILFDELTHFTWEESERTGHRLLYPGDRQPGRHRARMGQAAIHHGGAGGHTDHRGHQD